MAGPKYYGRCVACNQRMYNKSHHCPREIEEKSAQLEEAAWEDDGILDDSLSEVDRMELGFELLHREDDDYDWNY